MPCMDQPETISADANISMIQKADTGSDQCRQEACGPFCTCTCCSTARYLLNTSTFKVIDNVVLRTYADYGIPAIQKQSTSIWQPPKLV